MKWWGPERNFHRKINIRYVCIDGIYTLLRVYMPECILVCFQIQYIITNLPIISWMKQEVVVLYTLRHTINNFLMHFTILFNTAHNYKR